VLVTRAPDAPGLMLVEVVDGELNDLGSGRLTPRTFRFGRRTGQRVGDEAGPFDLAPLVTFARTLEARFGAPQNIEWAWDGRQLWLLSCREMGIEASPMATPIQREWEHALLLADDGELGTREMLVRNAACERLPRPTPATQSLIEALHARGGSFDRACHALGLGYAAEDDAPPLYPTVFGRLSFNVAEARRRVPRLTRRDRRRILRQVDALLHRMRTVVLPSSDARLQAMRALDFDALGTDMLVCQIRVIVEGIVTEMQAHADTVTIAAEVIAGEARRALPSASRREGGRSSGGETPGMSEDALRTVLANRTLRDFGLAAPWFGDEAAPLRPRSSPAVSRQARRPDNAVGARPLARRAARLVTAARSIQRLRIEMRHAALRELAGLRRALLALDRRFDLRNGIFLLSLDEIAALSNADRERVRRLAAVREAERAMTASAGAFPDVLSLAALELASWPEERRANSARPQCCGRRVAGTRRAGGRACVVDEAAAQAGQPLSRLMPGDVLVAPFVHEAWHDDIRQACGVVLGRGGWLCHAAVMARQRNIAMTVDVAGWADIPDGAYVVLELDGSIRCDEKHTPAIATEHALAGDG